MTEQVSIFVKMLIPQKPLAVKEAQSVIIPARNGPYQVLPRRAPAMKLLCDGAVVLTGTDQGRNETYFISAGIAKIRDNACTILTHNVVKSDEVDIDDVRKKLAAFRDKEEKGDQLDDLERKKAAFLQMIAGHFAK